MNGSRTLNSEFAVDGVSVVSGSTGGVQRVPSTEAIGEFRVQTSGYTAEYGRTSGGYVSLITDSGTNLFHGSLYEYFRNEKLNANDYFRNLRGQRRPVDRYNQFGGKLGGPVLIPKLYDGRDKTFFSSITKDSDGSSRSITCLLCRQPHSERATSLRRQYRSSIRRQALSSQAIAFRSAASIRRREDSVVAAPAQFTWYGRRCEWTND